MPASPLADRLFDAERQALADHPPRRPVSTYRMQLHKGFPLAQARAVVPYLHDLGVVDAYLSPFLDARPGSTHGYDVFDHSRINPEVGDDAEHARFAAALAERGMGRVLDIVPNHMGIKGPNRYWLDVLELGPYSPYASFFDIDWHPVKDELEGRVLLPILEDHYGRVLEDGKLAVEREGGRFFLHYHDVKLPLAPRSYGAILGLAATELTGRFDPGDAPALELRSIQAAAEALPSRHSDRPEDVEQRLRERSVLPRRLARLCDESPAMCALVDRAVETLRGQPGDPASFDTLNDLLEAQVYRLAYWRVAAQEINYRRFFDINDLAGLRVEDPSVYATVHAKIFEWLADGGVSALRIDHPDGLADPSEYFRRLQESAFLIRCRARFDAEGADPADWPETESALREKYRVESAQSGSPLARPLSVVAEKILSRGEDLPEDWPIDGTVGYEYLNALNGLFIDPSAAEAIDALYAEFTGDREPFPEVLYRSKLLIAHASLASEINTLSRQLNRVSEHDRRSRDFTLNDLRLAIRQVVACFPVYRTYLTPGEPISARDQGVIEQAVARARKRTPAIDYSLFDFLRSALMMEPVEGMSAEGERLREVFVRRFQQATGPIQAKGLEDTAFYRQVPLVSRNEVGADAARFGNSPGVFHALNAQRLSRWPGGLSTTATHDTKRGEDARIRIDALSEMPDEWRTRLARWSRINARSKSEAKGMIAPSALEEYLYYQALIGAWPWNDSEETPPGFVERITGYMLKAIREAKVNTSWNDPDPSYCEAVSRFVEATLAGPDSSAFLRDFLPFQRRISRVGMVHSLSQALVKVASPGVPDVYQGCELWDFSLVDPDNRRPVDYEGRARSLARIDAAGSRSELARDLFAAPEDGAIKQYVLATALRHRREHPDLYAQGTYRPLEADGAHKGRVVAFGRHREGRSVIAAGARLVAPLMGDEARAAPVGEVWEDTRLILPEGAIPTRWRDLLTDRTIEIGDEHVASLAEVFAVLPVALLVAEG